MSFSYTEIMETIEHIELRIRELRKEANHNNARIGQLERDIENRPKQPPQDGSSSGIYYTVMCDCSDADSNQYTLYSNYLEAKKLYDDLKEFEKHFGNHETCIHMAKVVVVEKFRPGDER